MELSQPEIIQILRRRVEMNQGTLGAKAFETSFESGRTKIKNIELGKQTPTGDDLKKIARVLGVSAEILQPNKRPREPARQNSAAAAEGIVIHKKTLALVADLGAYLDMLNKAVMLEDKELIQHISEKLSDTFSHIGVASAEKERVQQNA
ncbi:MAG: helix-turn-helix transcriptional regulator [Desulfobacterales bacterium]